MRIFFPLNFASVFSCKEQLLSFSVQSEHFCFLESNNYPNYPYSTFGSLFALDAIDAISINKDALNALQDFQLKHQDWLFGYVTYDVKNEIEDELTSTNPDGIGHPLVHFFVPKYVIKIENDRAEIGVYGKDAEEVKLHHHEFIQQWKNKNGTRQDANSLNMTVVALMPQARFTKEEYIETVEQIKTHIRRGDIYEMNLCQEFFIENAEIDVVSVFHKLNTLSKAPFTSFFKNEHQYVLCASPERFLKRQKNKLISQPIKGTRKRGATAIEDKAIKQELFFNEKERSENVMIVDLVRNDFSRLAKKNSVEVEELFGIYSFEQVHQLISTITCTIDTKVSFTDILRSTFPMGSMTGAPKISAMHIIETLEKTKRGLFSGCVGYITPHGNFDFNVVIRSILYNAQAHYISMQTGSAITIDCDAEQEYEECLLKGNALFMALQ